MCAYTDGNGWRASTRYASQKDGNAGLAGWLLRSLLQMKTIPVKNAVIFVRDWRGEVRLLNKKSYGPNKHYQS
jgi:hypothetical protein